MSLVKEAEHLALACVNSFLPLEERQKASRKLRQEVLPAIRTALQTKDAEIKRLSAVPKHDEEQPAGEAKHHKATAHLRKQLSYLCKRLTGYPSGKIVRQLCDELPMLDKKLAWGDNAVAQLGDAVQRALAAEEKLGHVLEEQRELRARLADVREQQDALLQKLAFRENAYLMAAKQREEWKLACQSRQKIADRWERDCHLWRKSTNEADQVLKRGRELFGVVAAGVFAPFLLPGAFAMWCMVTAVLLSLFGAVSLRRGVSDG